MRFSGAMVFRRPQRIAENGCFSFLSLSERERIKVRDFPRLALRSRTKSSEGRRPNSPALHRSKSEVFGFRPGQKIALVLGPCDGVARKRARSRRVPQRAALPRSKNPGCIVRPDAGAGIYYLKERDYVDGAKVCARMASSFCAKSERDSSQSGILIFSTRGEALLLPLTLILSPAAEERRVPRQHASGVPSGR